MGLPWLEAVICLFHKNGKTLFMDYRDYPHKIHEGKYSPPGGKINAGEAREAAAIREPLEEAKVTARNPIYRGTVNFDNERRTVKGQPMKVNMTVHIYDFYDFDDSNAQATEEKEGRKAGLKWIVDKDIMQVKELHEGDRKMFEWLGKYREFEGTIAQIGEELGEFSLKYAKES